MNTSQLSERKSVANESLEALLDEYQYALIRRCSVATVRRDRFLRKGCPYVKIGALVRYRPQDVRAFIERNLQGGEIETESR
jgi:hypothetical protein